MPVSVLSFLSSNLQKNFEDSKVDTASLLSFPLFSKAPAESQSPFVDSALHPEYHSAEKSSSGLSKANRNEVPSTVHNLSPDTRSHTLTHAEDFSDNSFSHTNPTPSRLSVEALVSSPAALVPDFGPAVLQLEFPESELNMSVVLWPSSDAASLSVRPFLVHSHQKDLSEIETRSVLHTGLTSLPTAGIWGHDHTLALLRANIEGKQEPPSSSASSTSSSNVFLLTQSSHIPSFTDSVRETEGMMGEETVLTQKSLSGSQERDSSSPTVNRDPWRLHHAVSHLHNQGEANGAVGTRTNSQAPAGYDSGFSLSTPPLLNPSQMLAHRDSSSAQLGVTALRHAPGMDLAHVSGLTRANTVQPGRLNQTHISAHTQLPTHSNSQAHTQNFRSDGLNLSEGANTRGPWQQSPILSFFTPSLPVLSPSMSSSVSLLESVSLLLPSQHLSYTYPPVSPSVSTLSSSFLLPSRATWPAAPASMMNTEIGSLSPTRPTVRFLQPTAAQSLQRPTIQPVEEFISNTQSLSFGQVSMESIQSRLLISPNQDEVLSQFTNHSQPQNASTLVGVLISEASNKQTAGGRLSHLSAPFNPADVVPKIHFANEHVSPVSTKAAVILSAVTGHHPNEHVTPQSALNSLSSPVDMQNTPCPISESCYQPGSATSSQPNVALVLPTPLQSSDLNTPSSTFRSPTGFSIEIANHGFISGLDELSPPGRDNHTTNTAGFKYIPESNSTTAVALRDSPVAPAAMTNITAAKDASALVEKGSLDVSEGSMTGSRPVPVLVNAAAAAKSNLTASEPGLNSSPSVSNHSRNQSSGGLMKGDVNQDHGTGKIKNNNLNFSPTPPAAASGWHLITPKISSPTPPFRALSPSANAGSSSGLKKATLHPSLGSPTANPSIRPTLPCRCKQRFLFTCQCGLPSGNNEQFYRFEFVVDDSRSQTTRETLKSAVALWLNQTFQDWIHKVYVGNISVQLSPQTAGNLSSYECRGLLVYTEIINESLSLIDDASARLRQGSVSEGVEIQSASVEVKQIENCPYNPPWPETRPTVTEYQPCFPNKKWRTCLISSMNYSSYWSDPDVSNCTDIDSIQVSAENASDVAEQLKAFTNNKLNEKEVSKVVSKVEQLVNVSKINFTLASSIVTIISNVMSGSVTVPAASDKALKTVDELVQKIQFDGPSIQINSKNLAVGILALNTTMFNETTLSAFMSPNKSDPQIDFKSKRPNPLAQVTLPASLLSRVSHAEADTPSRISFMFFNSPSFFQKKEENKLISYVVASSVVNVPIHNLRDPVRIEIAHRSDPARGTLDCVFWNFTKITLDGTGDWSKEGCKKNSTESTANKTVCLCDHLTHFGVLLDISQTSPSIDEKNNNILTFISYIGCGISAIFSAATLLTYIAFEKLRRDYPSKILMNLSTSLLFLNMVFLLDSWLSTMEKDGLCKAVAIFLHYFLLTSFTWMGLESVHMYIALVKVFNTYIRRYILKFCIVGWGLPAVLVVIVSAVDKDSYNAIKYEGGSKFCWITNKAVFYTTCVGYFCLVFLLNMAMFVVVMLQICGRNGKRSNRTLRKEVLRNLRSAISLTFLLGMTWGFAFFAWGPVKLTFMYLFSIFNSLQGLFIFIFHCALKENVQKQWKRYLCCGRFKLSDNSDWSKTATNNTKKVSSDNLGKSLSSSSFGSTTANWTSKAKATLNPFKRHSNTDSYSSQ
ncbi:adhesion G-protein coupled receptor G6 isoform X3 [Simochromis diagramma]|uniref:adhesion G-protein coupled receptor G6 isoform X3 n=1 Tax=Simochromis diagramma TaxID=43689 RepID=UPI001A7EBCBE|nr:adhesion G-protein coupled receptor G6 isoform X3 [Simochromis diagramma]